MTTRRRVKSCSRLARSRRLTATEHRGCIAGVIASSADLNAAIVLKDLPDLFELRLDSLFPITNHLEKKIARLRAPLIITARDPREGGTGNLSRETRRSLLRRFLPRASCLDVELRNAHHVKSLLADAKKRRVRRILSYHNFKSTPSSRSLCAKARQANALGADIFKVATRTDSPAELARLVDFIMCCSGKRHSGSERVGRVQIAVMGIGKFGTISRLLLARCGSVLNYAHLGRARVTGQPSVSEIRRWALDVER